MADLMNKPYIYSHGTFLCGCKDEPRQGYHPRTEKGLSICPEHGYNLHGFLSPQKQGPQSNQVTDYSKFGSGKSFTPPTNPESIHRQFQLRSLDDEAQQILKNRKAQKNGSGNGTR